MPSKELEPKKTYKMPQNIANREIDGKFVVIAVDNANWLVLDNERQVTIFDEFCRGETIGTVWGKYVEWKNDILNVLKQIEGKQFASDEVNYAGQPGMYIYMTNKCNEFCKHCYMYAGQPTDNELTTEEIERVVQEFSSLGGKVVTFTGGEATIRRDFLKIATFAKGTSVKSCLLTNGLLLTQEYVKKLAECIDEVQISLDGYDRNSYFAVRQVDGFERALQAVEYVVEAGIRTTVAITPLPETLDGHEADYRNLAASLQHRYEKKDVFVKFSKELLTGRMIVPSKQDNEAYKHKMQSIIKAIAPFSAEEGFAIDHRHNIGFVNCGYGWPTVAANGDVFACNLINECKKQGNIREDDFLTIWNRLAFIRKKAEVHSLRPCGDCELKLLCGGGCRIRNFPKLVQLSGNDWNDTSKLEQACRREPACTIEYKQALLRLLIRADRYFYR